MNWQDKYLCSLVERDKFRWKKVWKLVQEFWELFIHSISFHKTSKEPEQELPEFKSQDDEIIYSVCKEFFNNANDRIDKLEDKGLKLLSYITALFAFISFAFINSSFLITKIILLIAMLLLLLSILISFRCVNVKGRKAFFLPDVYNFGLEPPEDNFNKRHLAKKLLNSAIYNQNVADNTADILRAARYMLTLSIIVSVIGFLIGVNSYFYSTSKINLVKIDNQINLSEVEKKLDNTNKALQNLNDNVNKLDNNNLNEKINTLTKDLESVKKKLDELQK